MKNILLLVLLVSGIITHAQNNVGIGTNTPHNSAKLEISDSTKGILIPRMNSIQRNAIVSPANGLLVYDNDSLAFMYFNGSVWKKLNSDITSNTDWSRTGNSGTNAATNFIGTTDNVDLVFKNNNNQNMRIFANGSWLVGDSMQSAGVRTFFDITKKAFRTGEISSFFSRFWNSDSIGNNSFATGLNTKAKGNNSNALGNHTAAIGDASTAMGHGAAANGETSTAFGDFTEANGETSTAMGNSTIANGQYSTSMGYVTKANGANSTAMGIATEANGPYSTAIGGSSKANGAYSTAIGNSTIANGFSALVIGLFNDTLTTPQSSPSSSTPLFIVGNGTSASVRSNAMVVRKDGNVGIGINAPTCNLDVNGKTKTINFQMTSGAGTNKILQSDASGNASWVNPTSIVTTDSQSLSLSGNNLTISRGNTLDLSSLNANSWKTTGNIGTNADTNFIGTTDSVDLVFKNNNNQNMRLFADGSWLVGDSMQGAGIKTFFNSEFGAFRTGYLDTTYHNRWNNDSLGISSFAAGENSNAKGKGSIALGELCLAKGDNSIAAGLLSEAIGINSIVFGWNSSSSGLSSIAMGYDAYSTDLGSVSMGFSTRANGMGSTALGFNSQASNDYSTSIGYLNTSLGNSSVSIGQSNSASDFSTAIGYRNRANSQYSTALGNTNETNGQSSTVFGMQNKTFSFGETVLGIGATNYTTTSGGNLSFRSPNSADRLFVIGNAIDLNSNNLVDSAERSNAMVVLKNGNTAIGNITPTSKLDVDGKTKTINFQMTNTAGANRYLKSDALGNATWDSITANEVNAWGITGNSGTNPLTNFIGTTDNVNLNFRTFNTQRMTIENGGQVGINTITPLSQLHIVGNLGSTGITPSADAQFVLDESSDDLYISILTDTNKESGYQFGNQFGGAHAGIYYNSGVNTYDMRFRTNGNNTRMTIDKFGQVGIGTTTPSEKLDVVGKTKTIDFQMTNGAGANKYLKSDALGNATWDSITANEVNAWGITGNSGTNPLTNFIGTTNNVDLVFKTNNNQNMRLFANGSWLVGDSIQGGGDKTFFDTYKAAFRTGNMLGALRFWDRDSLGQYSFATGRNTKAKGDQSVAMGVLAKSHGHTSTAIGWQSEANGDISTAIGFYPRAYGDYSVAIGHDNDANGENATSMGYSSIANGFSSFVIGQYNDTIITPQTAITSNTPLFIIGNGVSHANRKNAVVVQNDGDFGINNNNPLRKLHILGDGGKSTATAATDAEFILEEAGDDLYMSILTDTNQESGYQFGNQFNGAHAGIYYNSGGNTYDMRFRVNGNSTKMTIDKDGQLGIGTTTPNSDLETTGSFATAINTTSSSITLDENYHTVILTSGTPTVTLPAASTCARRMYVIVNQTGGSRSISSYISFTGVVSTSIFTASSITLQSDGTNWYRIQ